MFSVTILFALLQLLSFAVGTSSFNNDAQLDVKRNENAVSSKTTSQVTTSASVTACPTAFRLVIYASSTAGRQYNYVNSTGDFNTDKVMSSTFSIQNGRLRTITAPGGFAAIPKGTGPNGGTISSKSDTVKYDFINVAFQSDCRHLSFTKKISATVTLDTPYAALQKGFYLASRSNPPEGGLDLSNILTAEPA